MTVSRFVSHYFSHYFSRYVSRIVIAMVLILAQGTEPTEAVCSQNATGGPQAQQIAIRVQSPDGDLVPCRIHLLKMGDGPQRLAGYSYWADHHVCEGELSGELAAGDYRVEIEHGPEFTRAIRELAIPTGKSIRLDVTLERIVDLAEEGWFSADLHVHRPLNEMPLLLDAEDLDFAPVIDWWNDQSIAADLEPSQAIERITDSGKYIWRMAGEDEREGGALLYFGLRSPLKLEGAEREFPSPMEFVKQAQRQSDSLWIDAEKPFWWDVPVWLAHDVPDSIGIANNHLYRTGGLENEAWGRPRPQQEFPGMKGNGLWSQFIYYQMLNAGLIVPPSAGSASGVLPNPVGYNRVYAHLEGEFSPPKWFAALKNGNCFVTNGPLLRVEVNKTHPGSRFSMQQQENELDISIQLVSRDTIQTLELIHNGNVVREIATTSDLEQDLSIQHRFDEPGWFLIRAVCDTPGSLRFASTAPWILLDKEGNIPIQKQACQFFLKWSEERYTRLQANVANEQKLNAVGVWHERAIAFWRERAQEKTELSDFERDKQKLLVLLEEIGALEQDPALRQQIDDALLYRDLKRITRKFTLAEIQINPEARVKIGSVHSRLSVTANQTNQFLLYVENAAGMKSNLRIRTVDLATKDESEPDWIQIELTESDDSSAQLTGELDEFKLVELLPRFAGLREVRLIADAGQGTQDLGFRATTDILLEAK